MPSGSSLGQKLRQLEGLLGMRDISAWEERFITDMMKKSKNGYQTTNLTGNQVEKISELYERHFA